MAVQKINGNVYFYRCGRIDGRPVNRYVACGRTARVLAALAAMSARDAEEHRREMRRIERGRRRMVAEAEAEIEAVVRKRLGRIEEIEAVMDGLAAETARLTELHMTTSGYHRHKRTWRKRRMKANRTGREIAGATVPVDVAAVDAALAARPELVPRLAADLATIPRNILDALCGGIDRRAESLLIDRLSGGSGVVAAALRERTDRRRRELLGADPRPIESVLVDRIVVNELDVLEAEIASRRSADLSTAPSRRLAAALDNRLTQAQRRLTQAVKSLHLVQRKAVPVVSVQVAADTAILSVPPPPERMKLVAL